MHRDERMDYVGVRRVTPDGEIAGEARLLGLFTSKAYSEPASETPVLHRKLRRVLEAEDLIEGSHDYKGAVALFDTFPKDELFAAPVDDLRRAVVALLALEGTDRVRLLGRRSVDGRSASFILALPRDRYRTVLVDRVRKLFMRRFKARDVEAQHMLGEGGTRVRVHFRVHAPDGLPDVSNPELEREVVQLARTWDDALRDALVERYGAPRARLLYSIWASHLPDHYKGYTAPTTGANDIALLEQLAEDGPFLVSLQQLRIHTRVALYVRGPKIELGDALPMLEDLGLRVIEEISTRLVGDDETWIQEFRVFGPDGGPLDIEHARLARRRAAGRHPPRRRRDRQPQPARDHRRAGPPPGRDPARLPQVPPARRLALHRELPERRAGRELRGHREARAPTSSCASTRTSRPTRRPRALCAPRSWPTSTRSPRSTTTASCATSWRRSRPRCAPTPTTPKAKRWPSSCARRTSRRCRSPRRSWRSTSTRPRSRASTCAAARSPAAACAGRTARTTAPRSTG